jgi:hypothetical protein
MKYYIRRSQCAAENGIGFSRKVRVEENFLFDELYLICIASRKTTTFSGMGKAVPLASFMLGYQIQKVGIVLNLILKPEAPS